MDKKKQILTPSVMGELRQFYDVSSPEEKDSLLADLLTDATQQQGEAVEGKSQKEREQEEEEEEAQRMASIAYKNPLAPCDNSNKEDISDFEIDGAFKDSDKKMVGAKHGDLPGVTWSKDVRKKLYGHLSDFEIIHLAHKGMINPFINYEFMGRKGEAKISHGLCGYGYKIRAAQAYLPLASATENTLDPKDPPVYNVLHQKDGKMCLAPGEVVLCVSVEHLNIPEGVIVATEQLSEYLHCGVTVLADPVVEKFNGNLAMLVKNENFDKHVILYPGEGILKLQFIRPFSLTRSMFEKMYGSKAKK